MATPVIQGDNEEPSIEQCPVVLPSSMVLGYLSKTFLVMWNYISHPPELEVVYFRLKPPNLCSGFCVDSRRLP